MYMSHTYDKLEIYYVRGENKYFKATLAATVVTFCPLWNRVEFNR